MIRLAVLAALCLSAMAGAAFCAGAFHGGNKPFLGVALDGLPVTGQRLAEAQRRLGAELSMAVVFLQWPESPDDVFFPEQSLEAIRQAGLVPVVTWEPMYIRDGRETAVPAGEILSGRWDGYVAAFAGKLAEFGSPVVVRFAHEMNIARYHWGTTREAYGPESPKLYRAVFRHVRELVRAGGAAEALFAFCPNAENVPDASWAEGAGWNRIEAYWPGGDVVDVLGVDGYNWGDTRNRAEHGWQSEFRSFADLFAPALDTLEKLAPKMPLIVFETASARSGGDRTAWLEAAVAFMRERGVAGFCWFQADKEVDWRLGETQDAAAAALLARETEVNTQWAAALIRRRP